MLNVPSKFILSPDPVTIALTVKYDNAEQTPQGGQTAGVGFGATISQTIGAITG